MKKTALLVIAVALLATCVPAMSQQFADVPTDHWAYQAIQQLAQDGVIQGYPDGTFGGKRAMTRYEFAEALARAIPVIVSQVSTTGGAGTPGPAGPAGPQGPQGPAGPAGNAADVAKLNSLVREFQSELAAMGLNVDALKAQLAGLTKRVAAVEAEQQRVQFNGELNMLAIGTVINAGNPFDRDNRPLSRFKDAGADPKNPLAGARFFFDYDFGVKARVAPNTSVNALINVGTYLPYALNLPTINGNGDFTLYNLNVNTGANLGFLGQTEIEVGRMPIQLTPYTLQFIDPDSYTYITKLDTGNFVMNGGTATFNIGGVGLTAFAGKPTIGGLLTPTLLTATPIAIEQFAGARAVVGTPFGGNLGLTYYQAGLGATNGKANIYSGDLNFTIAGLGVTGEYAKSTPDSVLKSTLPALDIRNSAWNAKLAYQAGNLGLAAGYTQVEENYFAPGSWNRMGRIVNPVNVKGVVANANYALTRNISLNADAQFLTPNDTTVGIGGRTASEAAKFTISNVDKINYWKAGIKYALTSSNSVDLGWEEMQIKPVSGSDTTDRFISIGLGHSFNPNASMKLLYQIQEVNANAGVADRGGLAAAQFQFKY